MYRSNLKLFVSILVILVAFRSRSLLEIDAFTPLNVFPEKNVPVTTTSSRSSTTSSSRSTTRSILFPQPNIQNFRRSANTVALHARSSTSSRGGERSKRQMRVGQLVQSELSRILHTGIIKGHDVDYLDDELRQRISVVSVNVSPDLRQARVSVSVRAGKRNTGDQAVDKRRAYAWLVQNTKPIRHTLAQKMSHMKTSPSLTFVQVDVAAATDVMYLIDKVSNGYKRDSLDAGEDDDIPTGMVDGIDFDEIDEDDEDYEYDDDDDFF